jgi:aspartate dehydrogenase
MKSAMTGSVLLIGYGAIGKFVHDVARGSSAFRIGAVLVRPHAAGLLARALSDVDVITSLSELRFQPDLGVECAGHEAVRAFGEDILRRGINLVVSSTGALSDPVLHDALVRAATQGGAQLILPAGAIVGIDGLCSARRERVDKVTYTSRKPPVAWTGTPAEQLLDLAGMTKPVVFYSGSARAAARDFPKNANVAASIALAGVGFDATEVRLIADPTIRQNVHEVTACGAFGEMHMTVRGEPLPANEKTSALAAMSVARAVENCFSAVRM